jgi:hypothetical protein
VSEFEEAKRDLLDRIEKAIQDAETPKLEYEAPAYPPVFFTAAAITEFSNAIRRGVVVDLLRELNAAMQRATVADSQMVNAYLDSSQGVMKSSLPDFANVGNPHASQDETIQNNSEMMGEVKQAIIREIPYSGLSEISKKNVEKAYRAAMKVRPTETVNLPEGFFTAFSELFSSEILPNLKGDLARNGLGERIDGIMKKYEGNEYPEGVDIVLIKSLIKYVRDLLNEASAIVYTATLPLVHDVLANSLHMILFKLSSADLKITKRYPA